MIRGSDSAILRAAAEVLRRRARKDTFVLRVFCKTLDRHATALARQDEESVSAEEGGRRECGRV